MSWIANLSDQVTLRSAQARAQIEQTIIGFHDIVSEQVEKKVDGSTATLDVNNTSKKLSEATYTFVKDNLQMSGHDPFLFAKPWNI